MFTISRTTEARKGTRRARRMSAIFEQMEPRTLFSATLTSAASFSADVEPTKVYSTDSYIPVSTAKASGNFTFGSLAYLEFNASTLFPSGYKSGTIDNLQLTLNNTATSGAYNGTPGTFNVYIATDETTSYTGLRYENGSTSTGFAPLNGQLGTDAVNSLVGTGQFTDAGGNVTYTFSNLPAAVQQTIDNDINNGQTIRLFVTPGDTNISADFEGAYSASPSTEPQLALTVEQAPTVVQQFAFSTPSYSINENAGTETITVTRTGSSLLSTASVQYASSNGSALSGTNYTGVSGTLNFVSGQSSASFTIPIADAANMDGNKAFHLTLSNPQEGTTGFAAALGAPATSLVTIVDSANTANNSQVVTETTTNFATIEPSGPYVSTTNPNSYINVAGTANLHPSLAAIDFNDASAGSTFTPTNTVTGINSITLNLTQGGPTAEGTNGPLAVYLVSDSSTDITADGSSPVVFDTGTLPEGLGSQLGNASLLGNFTWTTANPTFQYTSVQLADYSAATEAQLVSDLNTGSKFRIVIVPENASVNANLEGNYNSSEFAPQIIINAQEVVQSNLPAWVAPNSAATWNASSHTLTVTGQTTIVSDPGTDNATILASGAAAQITVDAVAGNQVHMAGLSLTNGAGLTMDSLGASRTHNNHMVLVIGSTGTTAAPLFTVDAASTLNLMDNDMIVHNGDLSSVAANAAEGRNVTAGGILDGTWNGKGLTSSTAASVDAGVGYEQNALAVVRNSDLPLGSFSTFDNQSVGANDIIVKYTYSGDFTLSGSVDDNASAVFAAFYGSNAGSPGTTWEFGDTNGDGVIDDSDAAAFAALYGTGTAGNSLPQL